MIVGISLDSQAENKHFRDKFSFPFDLLCDVDKSLSLAYGAIEGPQRFDHIFILGITRHKDNR